MRLRRRAAILITAGLVAIPLAAVSDSYITTSTGPATGSVSPWAVATGKSAGWNQHAWLSRLNAIGVSNVRAFDQDRQKGYLEATASKTDLSGILWWTPAGQQQTFPINNLDGWRNYVKKMVTDFPNVTHWEVWNEPPNFTADTDPNHYATIVAEAYTVAKQVNPKVQIGLAAKGTDIRWLAAAIRGGARDRFDYVTLHPYERTEQLARGTTGQPTGGEVSFMSIVPQTRAMLRAENPAKALAPIRFTEIGIPTAAPNAPQQVQAHSVDENTQASMLVRVMTMSVAQGVEQVAWFEPWDGDSDGTNWPAFGLITRDNRARPAFEAYQRLIAHLGKIPKYSGWIALDNGALAFVFEAPNGVNLVAWSMSDRAVAQFGSPVTVMEPATGATSTTSRVDLTRSPLLISVKGGDAAMVRQLAGRYNGLAFGSTNPTVSAQASEAPFWDIHGPWRGIEPLTGAVPCNVGGGASLCPNGNVMTFSVAPEFAAWTPKKVRVAVRVFGARDRAGFNLKYDGDTPYDRTDGNGSVSLGQWKGAPYNKWTTVTMDATIAPAGKYGYTLRFDSDASAYSGWAMDRMTILPQ